MRLRVAAGCVLFLGVLTASAAAQAPPLASEFQVNTFTISDQYGYGVAIDHAGNFVVSWESYGQDGDSYSVQGRRFDNTGAPRGGEFQVNQHTTSDQGYPTVASDPTGNFVVVWQSEGQDGSGAAVVARRYDRTGAALGNEFPVNTYTTSDQAAPQVAMDTGGNFVVVWESDGQDGSVAGVFGQRYDNSGYGRRKRIPGQLLHDGGPADAGSRDGWRGRLRRRVAWGRAHLGRRRLRPPIRRRGNSAGRRDTGQHLDQPELPGRRDGQGGSLRRRLGRVPRRRLLEGYGGAALRQRRDRARPGVSREHVYGRQPVLARDRDGSGRQLSDRLGEPAGRLRKRHLRPAVRPRRAISSGRSFRSTPSRRARSSCPGWPRRRAATSSQSGAASPRTATATASTAATPRSRPRSRSRWMRTPPRAARRT